jgi:hypothetical protein
MYEFIGNGGQTMRALSSGEREQEQWLRLNNDHDHDHIDNDNNNNNNIDKSQDMAAGYSQEIQFRTPTSSPPRKGKERRESR